MSKISEAIYRFEIASMVVSEILSRIQLQPIIVGKFRRDEDAIMVRPTEYRDQWTINGVAFNGDQALALLVAEMVARHFKLRVYYLMGNASQHYTSVFNVLYIDNPYKKDRGYE